MVDIITICTCEICQPDLTQGLVLRDFERTEDATLEAAHQRKIEASRLRQQLEAQDDLVLCAQN